MRKINKPSTDTLLSVGSFVLTIVASVVASKVNENKNKAYLKKLFDAQNNTKTN